MDNSQSFRGRRLRLQAELIRAEQAIQEKFHQRGFLQCRSCGLRHDDSLHELERCRGCGFEVCKDLDTVFKRIPGSGDAERLSSSEVMDLRVFLWQLMDLRMIWWELNELSREEMWAKIKCCCLDDEISKLIEKKLKIQETLGVGSEVQAQPPQSELPEKNIGSSSSRAMPIKKALQPKEVPSDAVLALLQSQFLDVQSVGNLFKTANPQNSLADSNGTKGLKSFVRLQQLFRTILYKWITEYFTDGHQFVRELPPVDLRNKSTSPPTLEMQVELYLRVRKVLEAQGDLTVLESMEITNYRSSLKTGLELLAQGIRLYGPGVLGPHRKGNAALCLDHKDVFPLRWSPSTPRPPMNLNFFAARLLLFVILQTGDSFKLQEVRTDNDSASVQSKSPSILIKKEQKELRKASFELLNEVFRAMGPCTTSGLKEWRVMIEEQLEGLRTYPNTRVNLEGINSHDDDGVALVQIFRYELEQILMMTLNDDESLSEIPESKTFFQEALDVATKVNVMERDDLWEGNFRLTDVGMI